MSRYFSVPGKPIPQGSMKAFAVKGKAFTTSSNAGPLAKYRADLQNAYGNQHGMEEPFYGPVEMYITFEFKRPKSHYNANGDLKDGGYATPAPRWVTKKPDLDKLCRAVGDALTHYAYDDDDQVVSINAVKVWSEQDKTAIRLNELPDIP